MCDCNPPLPPLAPPTPVSPLGPGPVSPPHLTPLPAPKPAGPMPTPTPTPTPAPTPSLPAHPTPPKGPVSPPAPKGGVGPALGPTPAPTPGPAKPLGRLEYSVGWCGLLDADEAEYCKQGALYADQQIQSGTSLSQLAQQCTYLSGGDVPANMPRAAPTEGFRWGCYMVGAFSGDKNNVCSVNPPPVVPKSKATGAGQNAPGSGVGIVLPSFPVPCAQTCNSFFHNKSSEISACQTALHNSYDELTNGSRECPHSTNTMMECVRLCDPMQDGEQCVAQIVGCTLGNLQSQMLGKAQLSQPYIDCRQFYSKNA